MGVVQLDSVNVLVRSQELPLFARLGPHPRTLLADADRAGELFEYWGHEASLLPVRHHRLFRWRMERALHDEAWGGLRRLARERPDYLDAVYTEVAERGPITAGELAAPGPRGGPWWGWNDGKVALEALLWSGRLAARRRHPSFEREYAVPEAIIAAEHLDAPTPPEAEARSELLVLAARSLGVATLSDLADYHRQRMPKVRPLVDPLVEAGRLVPVQVDGWRDTAYLHPEAASPRTVSARALLSPFDPVVWFRPRAERLFDFTYRIEIYVPAPKRTYGYYVLPFLLGDRLVARVDLKADRAGKTLLVQSAWGEPGIDVDDVCAHLAAELTTMATWLHLDRVEVRDRGDLAPTLRRVSGGARRSAPAPAPARRRPAPTA